MKAADCTPGARGWYRLWTGQQIRVRVLDTHPEIDGNWIDVAVTSPPHVVLGTGYRTGDRTRVSATWFTMDSAPAAV